MLLSDIIGFAGVTVLLVAFLLNLLKVLPHSSRIYMLLNLIGAGMACAASIIIHYTPFIILEGVWTVVSLVALLYSFTK
jgi:hypothetical protein